MSKIDIIISLVLLLNVIYDMWLWFWRKYLMKEIELTSAQMKAFGVKPNEIGFRERKPSEEKSVDNGLNWTIASQNSPVFEMTHFSDLDRHSSLNSTQLSLGSMSGLSDSLSTPQSDLSQLNSTATSWEYSRQSTPLRSPDSSGLLRNRRSGKKSLNDSVISNRKDLEDYLKSFELKEQRIEEIADSEKRRSVANSSTGWRSPLTDSQTNEDLNQIGYQTAINSPLNLNDSDLESITASSVSKAMDSVIHLSLNSNLTFYLLLSY